MSTRIPRFVKRHYGYVTTVLALAGVGVGLALAVNVEADYMTSNFGPVRAAAQTYGRVQIPAGPAPEYVATSIKQPKIHYARSFGGVYSGP